MVKSKVLGFDSYGSIEVLTETSLDITTTETSPILIKTEHISVNPVEVSIRKGLMSNGTPPKNFRVLGNEIQGEIVEIASDSSSFSIGDKVMALLPARGDSEYVATFESRVFKLPHNMPLAIGAAFPMIATTAYWTLHPHFYSFKQGDTLGIVGASGNVGSLILQLAREKDITILALGSQKNQDYLKKLGANIFIDYKNSEQVSEFYQSCDYVINASLFNSGEELALSLVKERGTYLGLNSLPNLENRPDITAFFMEKTEDMIDAEALPHLLALYEKSPLALRIGHTLSFSLNGLKEAHRLIETNQSSGKIILKR